MIAHLLSSLLFVGQVSAMEAGTVSAPAQNPRPSLIQSLEKISQAGRAHIGVLANEVRSIDLCQAPEVLAEAQKNLDRRLKEFSVSFRRMKAELLLRAVESNPIDIVTAARFVVKVDDTRLAVRKKIADFDSAHHISENVGKVEAEVAARVALTEELIQQCLEKNSSAFCNGLRASRDETAKAVEILLVESDRQYRIMESALRNRINAIEARAAEVCKERAASREKNLTPAN